MRKVLSPTQKVTAIGTDVEDGNKGDEDERMLNEMEELTYAMERKKKRAKKLLSKRQAKVYILVLTFFFFFVDIFSYEILKYQWLFIKQF